MRRPKRKPSRRQVNIGFSPAGYAKVLAAAKAEGVTVTAFVRQAAIDAAEGHSALLAWLLAAMYTVRKAAMRTAPD